MVWEGASKSGTKAHLPPSHIKRPPRPCQSGVCKILSLQKGLRPSENAIFLAQVRKPLTSRVF